MTFEKSFFKPKQVLTAASLNKIEDALLSLHSLLDNTEFVFSSITGIDPETHTSEDYVCTLDEKTQFCELALSTALAYQPAVDGTKDATIDYIAGVLYDGIKYYCKGFLKVLDDNDFTFILGNFEAFYNFMYSAGEDITSIKDAIKQAGLPDYNALPFVILYNSSDSSFIALNVANSVCTEQFGTHTIELIIRLPENQCGVLRPIMTIAELPDVSTTVTVNGINMVSKLKLAIGDEYQILIDGELYTLSYTDTFVGTLPSGGSTMDGVYTASRIYFVNGYDLLREDSYYFTAVDGTALAGLLQYEGHNTKSYNLSTLKE